MLHICRSNDGLYFNRPYGVLVKVLACCATDQGSNPGQVISQKCLITLGLYCMQMRGRLTQVRMRPMLHISLSGTCKCTCVFVCLFECRLHVGTCLLIMSWSGEIPEDVAYM